MTSQSSANPHTRGIAEFVSGLDYDAIPGEVKSRIKLLMLDALGCGLYGADLEWSRILQQPLAGSTRRARAACGARAEKLSAPHAALVNGTQVQGFELDDMHLIGVLHSGCGGAAGAADDRRDAPRHERESEFLTAAVAGYEIGPRVGICMGSEHIAQGWHSGATVGVFAAASPPRAPCASTPTRPCTRSASPARRRRD